jgi:hypothetical protein
MLQGGAVAAEKLAVVTAWGISREKVGHAAVSKKWSVTADISPQ